MSTGVDSWAGNIPDIGPMYPFVGIEVILVIVGFIFWIGWHVLQLLQENRIYKEDIRQFGDEVSLTKILKGERIYHQPEGLKQTERLE